MKHYPLSRFFLLAATFVLAAYGPAMADSPKQTAIDPDIAESVFRYQFTHNASGQQSTAHVYCIGFSAQNSFGGLGRPATFPCVAVQRCIHHLLRRSRNARHQPHPV